MYEEIYKGRMLHLERMLKEYQELGYKEAIEFDNRLIMRNSQKLTRQTYHSILLRFLKATNKPVSQITYEDVEKYIIDLKKRGVSNQTLINNIAGIESFFKFLYSHPGTGKKRRQEIELILKLLKDKPKLQSSRDREIISEEEYEKLIAAFDSVRDKVITAVLYNTGARIAEVLTLKLKNVVYVGNNLMLKFEGGSKTKLHEKLIALTRARRMFEDYLNLMGYKNPEDYIFRASRKNKPLTPQTYGSNLKRALEKAGIKRNISAHLFRHTRATQLARMGISAIEATQAMGWASVDQWKNYSHTRPEETARRIAALESGGEIRINQQVQPRYKACPRCKEDKLPESYIICPHCGVALDEQAAIQQVTAHSELNKLLENPAVIAFLQAILDPKKFQKVMKALQEPIEISVKSSGVAANN